MAPFTPRLDEPTAPEIKSNFLGVKHDLQTELRKYRIDIPQVNDIDITNSERRRALIANLFRLHRPARPYASDYYSHVISAGGDLYNGDCTSFKYDLYPGDEKSTDKIITDIVFEGLVIMDGLDASVRVDNCQALDFAPEGDYRASNIISCKNTYSPNWSNRGIRIGTKFFPFHQSLTRISIA